MVYTVMLVLLVLFCLRKKQICSNEPPPTWVFSYFRVSDMYISDLVNEKLAFEKQFSVCCDCMLHVYI